MVDIEIWITTMLLQTQAAHTRFIWIATKHYQRGKKSKMDFFFYSILSTMLNWNLLLRFTEHILKSLTVFCKNRLYFSIQLVLGFSIPIIHISYNYEGSIFLVLISVKVLKILEFGAIINCIIVSILSEHSWYF